MAKCKLCEHRDEDPYTGKHCLGCDNGSRYSPIKEDEDKIPMTLSSYVDYLQTICHQGFSMKGLKINGKIVYANDSVSAHIGEHYINIRIIRKKK